MIPLIFKFSFVSVIKKLQLVDRQILQNQNLMLLICCLKNFKYLCKSKVNVVPINLNVIIVQRQSMTTVIYARRYSITKINLGMQFLQCFVLYQYSPV